MHIIYILLMQLCHLTLAVRLRPHISSSLAFDSATPLPPSTHATLTTLSQIYSAPLRTVGDFYFSNVTTGSYLFEIYCHSYFSVPLRIDVQESENADSLEEVQVWGTFRGNEWDNKGRILPVEVKGQGKNKIYSFEVQFLAAKKYIIERPGFSPLNLFKNPMILMASLTMIIVFGMPYLMDNIDPEIKAEFEQRQKPSAAISSGPNLLQNFDAAAWLAGSSNSDTKP